MKRRTVNQRLGRNTHPKRRTGFLSAELRG